MFADLSIPDFTFEVENPDATLRAMAERQLQSAKERFKSGRGVEEQLPRGKKLEGRPLVESGQLEASTAIVYSTVGKKPFATIQPTGDRLDLSARQKSRLRKLAKRRGAVRRDFRSRDVGELANLPLAIANAVLSQELKAELKKVRAKKIRARTNLAVAAILAFAPKDLRAKNGNRGRYDFWWFAPGERAKVEEAAKRVVRVALVEQSTGIRHSGFSY